MEQADTGKVSVQVDLGRYMPCANSRYVSVHMSTLYMGSLDIFIAKWMCVIGELVLGTIVILSVSARNPIKEFKLNTTEDKSA